ncbi:protein kinase C and casein kinase substrate in neurons protein 1-like isoform X2 [Pyxicephalus adspersus]|uniref:protein kinase C and casein kinase substrate in neurons protein 1-like isoform X2 n=1 Tax=Pyxicephalus adspersus TaxID=30357 RepID=UPI003B59ED9E
MSLIYSEVADDENTNDSFWMPNNYGTTVKRTEDGYQLCDDIIACFQDRAKIEKQYALQMEEWTHKWKPLVDGSSMYGTLLHAWKSFMMTTERLSALHVQIQKALMTDDTERIRNWQKETYRRKIFGGFKESCELENGFRKAQKPWAKKLKKLEKAKSVYHKACKKEHLASVRDKDQGKINPELSLERQRKLTEEHVKCKKDMEKVKQRYEKALQELNKYNPKYMEEMESVFDQSQQLEKKKILFLKQALLSIHKHLDITNNESIMTVYGDLNQAIMAVNEQEDLKGWRNRHGPGMLMNWPQIERVSPPSCSAERKKPAQRPVLIPALTAIQWKKRFSSLKIGCVLYSGASYTAKNTEWNPEQQIVKKKKVKEDNVKLHSVTSTETSMNRPPPNVPGVRVRAVYDYSGQESDELSFTAGDELTKIGDEDEQGWCKGVTDRGQVGLYPANYVEVISA